MVHLPFYHGQALGKLEGNSLRFPHEIMGIPPVLLTGMFIVPAEERIENAPAPYQFLRICRPEDALFKEHTLRTPFTLPFTLDNNYLTLSPSELQFAHLDKEIAVVGCETALELWNPEHFLNYKKMAAPFYK